MNMVLKIFLFFILFWALIITPTIGQDKGREKEVPSFYTKRLKEAKQTFELKRYSEAILLYEKLDQRFDLPDSSKIRLAKACLKTKQSLKAEAVLKEIGLHQLTGNDLYLFALTLLYNNKYPEAEQALEKFQADNPEDPRTLRWKKMEIPLRQLLNENRYIVTEVNFNSRFSDFSPLIQNGIMYFSSTRPTVPFLKNKSEENFLKVFRAENFENPRANVKVYVTEFKTRYNDGPVAFNRYGTEVFITRNMPKSLFPKSKRQELFPLGIFHSIRKPDGSWHTPQLLPFNAPSYSCAHAFLTKDGNRLYFVSDMPGGFGKSDIYYVDRQSHEWGQPVNLGPEINTEGNEMFPFVDDETNLFYFTSDGHPGLGGLDLFVAKNIEGKYVVKNMGSPVNSPKDDFSIFLNPGGKDGYFASNRPGGTGSDDIYQFKTIKRIIFEPSKKSYHGIVLDQQTQETVPNAILGILDKDGNFIHEATVDKNGTFFLPDTVPSEITIFAAEEYFFPYEQTFSLSNPGDTIFVRLKPKPVYGVTGRVISHSSQFPVPNTSLFIYSNNIITDTLKTTNDGLFKLKLHPFTDYTFMFYKKGYFPLAISYSTLGIDTGYVDLGNINLPAISRATLNKTFEINISFMGNTLNTADATLPLLDGFAQLLTDNPLYKMKVRVHTSSRGAADLNLKISKQRAMAVSSYLINMNIDSTRIIPVGYGETLLKNRCKDNIPCTEEEHLQNERTEILLRQ